MILLLCSSCTLCCLEEMRRPPVMSGIAPDILDYNEALIRHQEPPDDEWSVVAADGCFVDCDIIEEGEGEEENNFSKKSNLKPDFFNPYHPLEEDFLFSIGDILEVSVFGDEETEYAHVAIAPDGRLYYTFLDGIPAAGRSLSDVRKEMEEALSQYFNHPMVVIVPISTFSQSYKIFGRVQMPGVYPIHGPIKLRQAIGEAGGILKESYEFKERNSVLNPLANLKKSYLIRRGEKLNIDFEQLLYTPNTDQDIYLRPGDYIYIAEADPQEVYVLGAAIQPSRIEFFEGMTLTEALAEARGFPTGTPYSADMSRVLVIRGALECPLVVEVDLQKLFYGEMRDIILAPNDIVYVYHKTLRFGRVLVLTAINNFVQAFATTAAGYYAQIKWFPVTTSTSDVSSP